MIASVSPYNQPPSYMLIDSTFVTQFSSILYMFSKIYGFVLLSATACVRLLYVANYEHFISVRKALHKINKNLKNVRMAWK
jgi:hypothetical protein